MNRVAGTIADAATRARPDGLGFAVFAAWLLLVASGFWNVIVRPMQAQAAQAQDPAQRALVEHWAREALGDSLQGRRAVVLVDPLACACQAAGAAALAARLRGAGARVAELPGGAPRLPQRPEVVVLDAEGRLRYAGPAAPTLFCTTGHSLAEAALAAAPADFPALVLPAECRCDEAATVAKDRLDLPST
jgi:hypothetical protein